MPDPAFDLSRRFVHLGLGARAVPVPDFEWSAEFLDRSEESFGGDGDEGRLVCVVSQDATWDTWERDPAGEELVVVLTGHADLIQDLDGTRRVVDRHPGQAVVNPRNVWHATTVHEPGTALFITPGPGTEHRPR